MNILFLCTSNLNRSKTCEVYFREHMSAHDYQSGGLSYKNCERFNTRICTHELLEWADIIFVFEQMHIERIKVHHGDVEMLNKIVNLNIDDIYQYYDVKFIELIEDNDLITEFISR
jgi:predicted protein tyrosine phosphatase